MFLSPRLGALERLVSAARPGGWVASAAPDFSTVALSPTSVVWQRVWSQFLDAAMAGGWDPGYGARLLRQLTRGRTHRCARRLHHTTLLRRVAPLAPSVADGRAAERERMVLLGADNGEIDEARRLLEEPASAITSPTTCMARGRRPGPP